MQQTQNLYSSFFLRRKHKLLRAIAHPNPQQPDCNNPRQQLLELYNTSINKDRHISQIDYFLKHQFHCNMDNYSQYFIEIVWEIMKKRSGSIASFIVYRLCRKYPQLFWTVFETSISQMPRENWAVQQVIYFTDLFLYGFPLTLQDFMTKIFPHFRPHLIDLIQRYQVELQSNLTFPVKYQKILKANCLQWLQEEKDKISSQHEKLQRKSLEIQNKIATMQQDEEEMTEYQIELQRYETQLHRFEGVSTLMEHDFEVASYRVKTIFQLKKECQTFKTTFILSPYEESLYTVSNKLKDIRPLKKHQMLKLQQSQAFINQIKLCKNVDECLNLGGYFLQQMNVQKNRQYLIETIINQCYQYNNISYILKIVFQISERQPTIREYCQSKAKKICSTSKMNQKYQKLLCQMVRFNLINQNILLEYCERVLKNQNPTTVRQVESILEQLGTIVYYRSLQSHIRINGLFERMEAIIKGKLVQFNTQHLYNLKGLLNYLQNHASSTRQTETRFMSEFQIKENFDFILSKMQKLLKDQENQQIVQYLIDGVDNQEYLTSYYYASLLRELNSQQIQHDIHRITTQNVQQYIRKHNYQKAVIWSRFLGELYNYKSISRQRLLNDLAQILNLTQEQFVAAASLKCVCSALETSKTYLKSNSPKKQRQIILFLLNCKKAYLRYSDELQFTLICQFQDISSYFHPQILIVLNSIEQIDQFTAIVQSANKINDNVNSYISRLAEGASLQELKAVQTGVNETKKKYKEKEVSEKTQRRWVQKEPTKVLQSEITRVSEFRVVTESESMGKQSVNTIESVTVKPVKKMKFIGRSKKDNQITTVSCSISESP